MVLMLKHRCHAVTPAQIDQRVRLAGFDQVLLQKLLLQVDHGAKTVVLVVRGFHAEHALAPVKRVAKAPGQAVLCHTLGHAHLLQDFHGAAGEHDGTAALAHLQLRLQQHTGHPKAGQLQGSRQAHGAATRNDHGVPRLRRMLRGQPGLMHGVVVINRAAGLCGRLVHGALEA